MKKGQKQQNKRKKLTTMLLVGFLLIVAISPGDAMASEYFVITDPVSMKKTVVEMKDSIEDYLGEDSNETDAIGDEGSEASSAESGERQNINGVSTGGDISTGGFGNSVILAVEEEAINAFSVPNTIDLSTVVNSNSGSGWSYTGQTTPNNGAGTITFYANHATYGSASDNTYVLVKNTTRNGLDRHIIIEAGVNNTKIIFKNIPVYDMMEIEESQANGYITTLKDSAKKIDTNGRIAALETVGFFDQTFAFTNNEILIVPTGIEYPRIFHLQLFMTVFLLTGCIAAI